MIQYSRMGTGYLGKVQMGHVGSILPYCSLTIRQSKPLVLAAKHLSQAATVV